MKSFKKEYLIICWLIFGSFEIIYSKNSETPKVDVIIEKGELLSKNKGDRSKFEEKITIRLTNDFKAAWEAIENKIATLPECYKNAFDEYKLGIKYGYDNKFVIHFDLDEKFIKYHNLKGIDFSQTNFPGDHSGNAEIKGDPYNEITIYNVYAEKWFVKKYVKNTEKCSYEYILSEVNKYLCEKRQDMRADYFLLHLYNWSIGDKVYFSIKNMIIHEIFHLVLFSTFNMDLFSRFADEATISDTALKISPLQNGNKDAREYYYEFITWLLDNQHTINIPSIFVILYIRHKFYDGIDRKFNPPLDLEYNNKGYTLNGYCTYIPVGGEMIKADDCRCNPMKNYVIPPKCCK